MSSKWACNGIPLIAIFEERGLQNKKIRTEKKNKKRCENSKRKFTKKTKTIQ